MGPLLPGPGSVSETSRVSPLRDAAGAHTGRWVPNYLGFSWPLPQSRLSLGVQWGEARGEIFSSEGQNPPSASPLPTGLFLLLLLPFLQAPTQGTPRVYLGGVQAMGGNDTVSGRRGLAAVTSATLPNLSGLYFSRQLREHSGHAHISGLPGGLGRLPSAAPGSAGERCRSQAGPRPGVLSPLPARTLRQAGPRPGVPSPRPRTHAPPLCSPGPGLSYRLRLPLEAGRSSRPHCDFHGLQALVLSRVPSSNKSKFLKIVFYDHASTKMNILFIKTLSDVKLIYLFLSFKRESFGGPPEMLQAGVVSTGPSAQASEVDAGAPGLISNRLFHLTSTP